MIYLDDMVSRWMRLASMFAFFLLFLSPWYYNKQGLLVFTLLLISDVLLINFENPFFNALIFIVRASIFLAFIGLVLNRLKQLQTNLFQKIVFTIAIGLNVFLLYMLVTMVSASPSYTFYDILFYFYGISVIMSVSAAVSFSNRYTNRASIFFLGTVLSLAFSDLAYFIAYNLNLSEFFLADITFNLLGIAFLLKFMFLERLENKEPTSHLDNRND
ncbi:hypothetical protein [Gillisia hiemivivida]|uniref:Uncharacterized protein n=1 Tax=Gillisia hiemivivida TaxID=291190 RepID=A0A5C6ZP62_9FLAO|nr:hypothetical protein [Gillisia hiemivivida]TXD92520.1 hypothetical protein ES724_13610 [Gillisia hiemivivida]